MFQELSSTSHALSINIVKCCVEKLRPYLAAKISVEVPSQCDLQKEYHEVFYEICQQPPHLSLPIVSSTVRKSQVFSYVHAPSFSLTRFF